MGYISAFIDESGDTGSNSDYYLLTLVFHEQDNDINNSLKCLDQELVYLDFPIDVALHAGPIIRREHEFKDLSLSIRRKIFFKLFSFARTSGITYKTFVVKKKECGNDASKIKSQLSKEIGLFLQANLSYFQGFDRLIIYYDNGQSIVTDLINAIFSAYLFDVDIRKVVPSDYRLFQVADMLCTLELLNTKLSEGKELSKSEKVFFESRRRLIKVYLKSLSRFRFEG